jgi:alkylation response protein AidB-like acyl-CoA dehydrogenase
MDPERDAERLADACTAVSGLVGDRAESWDLAGLLPEQMLRELAGRGLLCPQVPATDGGLGFGSLLSGEYTAHVGSLCSSLRSVLTSQAMAAWTVQRFADARQRHTYLAQLTHGELAALGFSETAAGSDLSAMTTRIVRDGDTLVVTGEKVWMTAACYADLLLVFGRFEEGAAVVVVPASTPGVRMERIANPLGCRAAGHANVRFDAVRLPSDNLLGGIGQSMSMLVTTALAAGRLSVAWGCVGILRACLAAATGHARTRQQFGKVLAEHQLISGHLAELYAEEQVSTRSCEYASRCWDAHSVDMVAATVVAKYVSARNAVAGAASAVQVLASAGARDGHLVARAYRDAKLMEIIEGSNEICQLMLAEHALSVT